MLFSEAKNGDSIAIDVGQLIDSQASFIARLFDEFVNLIDSRSL